MRKALLAVPILFCGMAWAEAASPVGTVSSREPFVLQGVTVPVVGSTSWPAMEGDVIETKTASAEIRLKDGTRIFVPQGARVVVSSSLQKARPAQSTVGRSAVAPKAHNAFVGGVLNILDGGAFVVKSSMLETLALSAGPKTVGSTNPAVFSLAGLVQQYGPNNPIIAELDRALLTPGRKIQFDPATNSYYITGLQVAVGNGAPQSATFIVSGTQIQIVPGTINPGAAIPPALVIVMPPIGSGTGLVGCKGGSLNPVDVSNSVIRIPTGGTC